MRLTLKRYPSTQHSTPGVLFIDGVEFCVTLEDVVREGDIFKVKVPHETAIPFGTYEVIINFSNRFKRELPLLLNVPNFTGVRIHPGNDDGDSSGCILLGSIPGEDWIGQSRLAFNAFLPKLEAGLKEGKVYIDIVRDQIAV